MGADFIREQSGQPWRKRWNKSVDRLKQPSLFDVQFGSQQRTITADIDPGMSVQAGEELVVQCGPGNAMVCRGQSRIGAVNGLPPDMRTSIAECGGVALGIVERVGLFGHSVELRLQ
jgi:hypothetical protein